LLVLLVHLSGMGAMAQEGGRAEPLPTELEGVGVTEHRDGVLPLDAEFQNERGRPVKLREYFDGERPVLLTLNYYRCPMLCTLQLNGLIEGLQAARWVPGDHFEWVTVSIDPSETPELARAKKMNYLADYDWAAAAGGWHCHTGREADVRALADAVGFGYRWNEARKEWMHVAAAVVCTPDGRISRYLYGVQYEPRTLKLSLIEASEGKIGSALDQIILYCYHYDADAGRYAPAAMNIMRAGGILTLLTLGSTLSAFWLREARRRRQAPSRTTT
jgi:protein SCO1/2